MKAFILLFILRFYLYKTKKIQHQEKNLENLEKVSF